MCIVCIVCIVCYSVYSVYSVLMCSVKVCCVVHMCKGALYGAL